MFEIRGGFFSNIFYLLNKKKRFLTFFDKNPKLGDRLQST